MPLDPAPTPDEQAVITETPRLIEHAFPLKQASLDSVHEKNVRHGHIATLHLWPARRPLAASRAALIAALLPDPSSLEERRELLERIGGKVLTREFKKKLPNGPVKAEYKEETSGGVLHWGREMSPDVTWFREQIRKAYGGRPPIVLDPFAGGGAIPLEAMRLGCEVAAIDINPVACFILKCTLEYPQKFAGQKRPLPKFALESPEFMREYWRQTGKYSKKQLDAKVGELARGRGGKQSSLADHTVPPGVEAGLAWHVRAWGLWVLECARRDLERRYPAVDGKPTVAYLWARIATCKNCRAAIPLLKTMWLCKKEKKRIRLTMEPNKDRTGVVFGIQSNVPVRDGNAAQRREDDKRLGQGTMSRNGAWCPCCGQVGTVSMTMEDIQHEGVAGRLRELLYAVVVNTVDGKEYHVATDDDIAASRVSDVDLRAAYSDLPFGLPTQRIEPASTRSISCHTYGLDTYSKLFTRRQLLANSILIKYTREVSRSVQGQGHPAEWGDAVASYLTCVFDKYLDYANSLTSWYTQNEQISHLFNRFALPVKWDFAETSPIGGASGSYESMLNSVTRSIACTMGGLPSGSLPPHLACTSASHLLDLRPDLIVTDPPYYEAVSYADLSDFFYVWLRLLWGDRTQEFSAELTNKAEEIVQHTGEGKNREAERSRYEFEMARAFTEFGHRLRDEGRLAIVFAHKDPNAWETLVSAMIRAGFVVDASWPIQTEMPNRSRGFGLSALSSSVWLVCRKRPASAVAGWDNQLLDEMRSNIEARLREFWDAGIRGPDFVWAATGPALEAYSKHPVVKKANEPGQVMTVSSFLRQVRRIVVDFVVGRVLAHNGSGVAIAGLDDLTTYYLLHRNDFGFGDAPAGACILYAISCGLSDSELVDNYDLLARTGGTDDRDGDESEEEVEDEDGQIEREEGTGSTLRLKKWNQRVGRTLGYETNGRLPSLIDRIHRLMHLWRAGDMVKVDEYLEGNALTRDATFHQVLQALIELAEEGSEERGLLERLSNHVGARGGAVRRPKTLLEFAKSAVMTEGEEPQ